jgi:excisionase family DNA binding protein
MSDPELLTIPEAAAILRCSERTLRRRAATGKIEAVEVPRQGGKAWMIPEHAVHGAAGSAAGSAASAAPNAASAASDPASAAAIVRLETQLANVQAFLAGQINTREAVREDVKLALDDALAPIVAALAALQRENEKLRDQIVAERAERAIEREDQPRGFWANITGRKRGQLPPDR